MDPECASDPVAIDVCVCTYQRSAALQELLQSLAIQRNAPRFRVLVADNHRSPVEAQRVAKLAQQLALRIDYVHAPACDISIARNACLAHSHAPLLAFIDDDQIAEPNWLFELHTAIRELDVVFGPVQARYPARIPAWVRLADFHSKAPVLLSDGAVDCSSGYTANVLIRRSCLGKLVFDARLGRSGGEDTQLFVRLAATGARFGFCPAARVSEAVDAERCRFGWLLKRSFASGQAHARSVPRTRISRLRNVPVTVLKIAYCLLLALPNLLRPSPVHWRRLVLRAALHLGVLASAVGAPDLKLYGQAAD